MYQDFDIGLLCKNTLDSQELLNSENFSEIERAYQTLKMLAAIGKDIPETLYKVYTLGVDIPREMLYAITSYFEGAGLVNIVCDCYDGGGYCEKPNHTYNNSYDSGLQHLREINDGYTDICKHIENIQETYR
jgi:hypothetical protein